MATRYAVANGNWSNTATWDGGTLPTAADDVHANNRTVTIDQNVTVLSLRTTAGGAAVAGGNFTIPNGSPFNVTATAATGFIAGSSSVLNIVGSGTRVITGNATGSATTANTQCIYVTHSSGNIPTVTINGNLLGGSQSGSVALYIWGGYVTVNGSVTGGTASTNAAGISIFNSNNQPTQLTVNTGPVTGGSSSGGSTSGISVGYSPLGLALTNSFISINCEVRGGTLSGSNAGFVSSSNIPITVVGNIGAATAAGMSITGNPTVNITGNCGAASGANYSLVVSNAGANINVTGTAFGSDISSSGSGIREQNGTFTVNGNIVGGNSGYGFDKNNNGTVTINGNVYGRLTGSSGAIGFLGQSNGGGTVTINGNVAATVSSAMSIQSTLSVTINGSVSGGTATNAQGIITGGTCSVTVSGTVTGGSAGSASHAILHQSGGMVTINNSITAGNGIGSHGVFINGSGGFYAKRAIGNGYGPGSTGIGQSVAVYSWQQGANARVEEVEVGSRGAWPLGNHVRFLGSTDNKIIFATPTLGVTKTLVDPSSTGLLPAASNVRSGVVYNANNSVGTMAVPAANSVAAGVPVDNTIGTAVLTQANVWDYSLSSASSVAGSVGEKLKKTAIPADIIALG